tara:strand:- start:456 stop:896 length:441 start_codon:yes stop_codon:yes gene_type:complete
MKNVFISAFKKDNFNILFFNDVNMKYRSNYRKIYKEKMGYTNFVQDHHCIPKQHKNHELLKKINFDTCDSKNLIIMPNKLGIEKLNLNPRRLIHDGGHIEFNKYILTELNEINKIDNVEECKYEVYQLLHFIKKNMNMNEDNLPWK